MIQSANSHSKKDLQDYRNANGRTYGCWVCKVTTATLHAVRKNLYACDQHRDTMVPR